MSAEPEFNAHVRCSFCHGLKAKADTITVDDKPICRHGTCKDMYEQATRPRPVPKSYARWEHG